MMHDPRQQKTLVLGLQGSGKTWFARELVKRSNLKVLVCSPHVHDFNDQPEENFIYYQGAHLDIERFFKHAIQLCKKGVINGVLIDEFDTIFRNNFDIGAFAVDAFASHRHYNMAIIGISRRPQDIPAYFVESCKFIVSFALQGDNSKKKLNSTFSGFGDLVNNLEYESREYIFKAIGKPPLKCPKLV
jgi:hypothetical protein